MRLDNILFLFILFLSFNAYSALCQEKTVTLKNLGPISNVQLKPNYAYYFFKTNHNYLVWYEGYTHTIFIYNFSKRSLKKVPLRKGRGPHEFLQISGFSISNNNIINLVDDMNDKLIRLNSSGTFLKDKIAPLGLRIYKIYNGNGYQVIEDINSQKAIYFLRFQDNFVPLNLKSKIGKEFNHNIYEKLGKASMQGHYLVQVLEYLPRLYVYDLSKRYLIRRIKFDDSKVDWGRPHTNSKGAKMMFPPSRVDIKNEDIAAVPGEKHRVFLLAKGASKHRTYGLNKLFEYDWKTEKFVGVHKLPFKVQEIATNNHYLFAYSKEKNKIYRFKVVPSK
jgi:hypothetical protein